MTDQEVIEKAAELADQAKKPGVFNILNVLRERSYPTDSVSVILDEDIAYKAAITKNVIDNLMNSDVENINDDVKKLQADLDALVEQLNNSRYVFNITGISEGRREELMDESLEKFPIEFDLTKNPFTGKEDKAEIPSPERDEYFTDLLWIESIIDIVAPDGSVQAGVDADTVHEFRSLLPVTANAAITQAIDNIRIATGVFILTTDEDFLAKP